MKHAIFFVCLISLLILATTLQAQNPQEILVIGVVPAGATLEQSKVPYPVQTGSAEALENMNSLSVADFLQQSLTSVSLNDAQNNPLQPDIQYRGFTASPLLGLAQGLAIYQQGVRVNEPLGDAVNWDLIPQSAIASLTLSGGANPLYGLNTLGGALVLEMKNGFDHEGAQVEISSGSFGRSQASVEYGGNAGSLAWFASLEHFKEDGWRQYSDSEALNFYSSVGWRSEFSELNLNYQYGDSELIGNGSSPIELLEINRAAIFTGPDVTENNLHAFSLDYAHDVSSSISFGGNLFLRHNETDSFNGDGSEFSVCSFSTGPGLIAGLEDDDLEEVGLEFEQVCGSQFDDSDGLEDFINSVAMDLGDEEAFDIEGFDNDELSGTGVLADDAINNLSNREQTSSGADFQWTLQNSLFALPGQLIAGGSYYLGESAFDAVVELSAIDPQTRLTTGLGTGTFVDAEATSIDTTTESSSLYFSQTLDVAERIALTASARLNSTRVQLQDRSGVRPELNGNHRFTAFNPALGLTWQYGETQNFYANISRSSRAPTPIELACNEGVFDLAVQYALEAGEDPDDVDFECRLPNAFLADPPLEDVVAESFEIGIRGEIASLLFSLGGFHTINHDDILFQTTGRQTGLFANVDKTRRQGIESMLAGQWGKLNWRASYSYISATFGDEFSALSPNHDFASQTGEIQVQSGDRLPGIPEHQFKLISNYTLLPDLDLGFDLIGNGNQYLRGDESNQLDPIDGYIVVNLRARYRLADSFELFAHIENLLDEEYETFGLLGEEPGELDVPIIEDLSVPVFLGAAQPRAGFIGFRYRF